MVLSYFCLCATNHSYTVRTISRMDTNYKFVLLLVRKTLIDVQHVGSVIFGH